MQYASFIAVLAALATSANAAPTSLVAREAPAPNSVVSVSVGQGATLVPTTGPAVVGTTAGAPFTIPDLSPANPRVNLAFQVGEAKAPLQCWVELADKTKPVGTADGATLFRLNGVRAAGCLGTPEKPCPLPTPAMNNVKFECADLINVMDKNGI